MTAPLVPINLQLAEVRREIEMRRLVYPRWVAEEKMTQRSADSKIEAMEAVAETLAKLAAEQQLI